MHKEPVRLQSMEQQRVRHDLASKTASTTKLSSAQMSKTQGTTRGQVDNQMRTEMNWRAMSVSSDRASAPEQREQCCQNFI